MGKKSLRFRKKGKKSLRIRKIVKKRLRIRKRKKSLRLLMENLTMSK